MSGFDGGVEKSSLGLEKVGSVVWVAVLEMG